MSRFGSIFLSICFFTVGIVQCPLDLPTVTRLKKLLHSTSDLPCKTLKAFDEKLNTEMRYADLTKEIKDLNKLLDDAGGRRSYEIIEFLTACTVVIAKFNASTPLKPVRRHTI